MVLQTRQVFLKSNKSIRCNMLPSVDHSYELLYVNCKCINCKFPQNLKTSLLIKRSRLFLKPSCVDSLYDYGIFEIPLRQVFVCRKWKLVRSMCCFEPTQCSWVGLVVWRAQNVVACVAVCHSGFFDTTLTGHQSWKYATFSDFLILYIHSMYLIYMSVLSFDRLEK